MSRTSLAAKNLLHQPARTVVSVGGIGFAILLMFMQLGFLGAVGDTATNVYRRLPCDLILRSPEYLHVYDPRSIPESVVPLVHELPEVADVRPIDLCVTKWQNPLTHEYRAVAVMGIDPQRPALALPELPALLPLLVRDDHLLVDRTSQRDFGPANNVRFGPRDIGQVTTVTDKRVRIAGTFEMGTGLAANGAVLMSRAGFRRIAPTDHTRRVSLVTVRLRPGITAEQGQRAVLARLRRAGGTIARTTVLTAEQARWLERWRWYAETPIGIIFAMGVALAVIVGGMICYMVLAADILSHLAEYATLKAIGYTDGYLARVLLAQSGWLAVMALPPATLAALLLYEITSRLAGVPIGMTLDRMVFVALLSLAMCSAAGWVSLRKFSKAEPAALF